jgi:hypothetical protein
LLVAVPVAPTPGNDADGKLPSWKLKLALINGAAEA